MNDINPTTPNGEGMPNTQQLAEQWENIDWELAAGEVNRLQTRIVKAVLEGKRDKVRRLQYLLTHSFYAKALAVRKVTTNKGKYTAGVDGKLWSTEASKMRAVLSLTDKGYKASPLRRVNIPKKGKPGKTRPLGIPTMYDRAMQALYLLALEPVAETTADNRSFGFRKERCAQDAGRYVHHYLKNPDSPEWILEGDIKGCFDHISHDWLMENIPMDKSVLGQWLKAGFIEGGKLFPTEEGTPQGGVISATLANMTLDGIEAALEERFHKNSRGKYCGRTANRHKVNFVRYADDFIVTAATRETAMEVKRVIEEFLKPRGLQLSEEKTVITHIRDGFDFLGWTFKKHLDGVVREVPSKKAVKAFTAELHQTIIVRGLPMQQDTLIAILNKKIVGWTNYHRHTCASETFHHIDHLMFRMLRKWARRRHPNKGTWWALRRYFHSRGNRKWCFKDHARLRSAGETHIVRHPLLKLDKNPFLEPDYFEERKRKHRKEIAKSNAKTAAC